LASKSSISIGVERWKDSYFESLGKTDAEIGRTEALELKRSNFPPTLYRYRSLDRLAYVLEEVREGYVFLGKPSNFNDPYDSALSISWEHALTQAMDQILPKYGYDPKLIDPFKGEERELAKHSFESMIGGLLSVSYGPSILPDPFSFFREKLGVGCFATNPNSVVMWSHYAKQHTGICLEFSGANMQSSAQLLEFLHPVRYTLDFFNVFRCFWRPEIDLEQVRFDTLPILAACHKSEDWKYEGEWRLVSVDPSSGRKFSLESCGVRPSRIILGANIDQPDRAAIEELAQRKSVPVVNARLAKDQFAVEF
jgi:hypothetical protein